MSVLVIALIIYAVVLAIVSVAMGVILITGVPRCSWHEWAPDDTGNGIHCEVCGMKPGDL